MQNTPQNKISKQPLFSVLIANYNNGKYLMDAIESVRRQTYTHWEIILVDDASTDNSKELYKELEKDNRIHIYYNEENRGCGYTKRRCADLANGELCGFLDPDDALLPEAIQVMVEAHIEHPDASLIHSDHYDCDEELNIMNIYHGEQLPIGMSFLQIQQGVSHFVTFKRSLYNKTNGINPIMKRAVDMDLYNTLDEVGNFVYINKALYYYRKNTGNNISLGEINSIKALCWDLLSMINACMRRDLSIDEIAFENHIKGIEVIAQQAAYEKELEIRNSKAYRLGNALLKPLNFLKKFLW